ncbi:MBOAT family O-acyltransferase [Faunimonas sp. B44]|uniref:MBOAT family O-acyltransferase n=1 Tax=Faunimonas sp. B44 TaxID=3461493 RepID=UPI004043E2AE
MLFNSFAFLLFLPLTLAVFAILPARWRWGVLLLASYGFYAAGEPRNLVWLAAVTAVAYSCGLALGRVAAPAWRKALLAGGLVVILGALVAFKFYDFAAAELESLAGSDLALPRIGIANPVGFSFYAFAAASYLIDAYRGGIVPERIAGRFALYVAYFPKLLAGPIERATTFLPQLATRMRAEPDQIVLGLQLIGWGLFKKVVIADNLAPLVDRNFAIAAYASPMELLVSVYFFAFQIYCDFSGYTDIAIGVSLLFGIRLMENFRRPYLSRSTSEFWAERWHISLGRWFRDYLYIPLGGSRAGPLRRYVNVMVVFVVSGLWHAGLGYGVGWTFLVWGALNGLYQWVEIALAPLRRRFGEAFPRLAASAPVAILQVLVTFHLILFTWIFFRARSIADATTIIGKIWAFLPDLPSLALRYPFTTEHAIGASLIALLMAVEILDERRPLALRLAAAPVILRWSAYYAAIFGLLVLGRWHAQQFIYMQF